MPPVASRSVYDARMHRVLRHIDAHIGDALDLHALAAVASFSPYHFHRLFAAWTGERLGDYLRRRRLEIGAARLASQPALGVLSVALTVGFGSAEAFSRAFKVHFGATPSAWRRGAIGRPRDRNPDQSLGNPDQAGRIDPQHHGASTPLPSEPPMNVRLETLQPAHVAYLRHLGPYGDAVSRFWQETVYPWMVANALVGASRYGISHDDPSITAAAKCRYDACVEVAPDAVLSGTALRTTLPGGRYAVLDFVGTAAEIGDAWSALLRRWLPDSGLQLDGRPCFEHYPPDAAYDSDTGRFGCRICVPVAPL